MSHQSHRYVVPIFPSPLSRPTISRHLVSLVLTMQLCHLEQYLILQPLYPLSFVFAQTPTTTLTRKAPLFCCTWSSSTPNPAMPLISLFTGFFCFKTCFLSLKVLGRMEGFKEGRSVSTHASSRCYFTLCIALWSIKAAEIPL